MEQEKRKQIPLRLSDKLYADIAKWANDDFRSINGQIEYLLTECVKARRSGSLKPQHELGTGKNTDN